MKVDLSCPIELWAYALPTEEKPACSFTFFNLGERPISSIQITVTCFDRHDGVLSRRVERPMALEARGREPFVVNLDSADEATESIDLAIDKAWFEDGSQWRRAQEARLVDYQPNELPPNRRLEQLRYVAGDDAVGYPSDQRNVWICVCGRVNAAEEKECRRCARDKEEVFERFSPEAVQEAIDLREHELEEKARQAREEASRQEFLRQDRAKRKKRARRLRTSIICAVLIIGVSSYLFVVLGLPELKYQTALSSLSSGDYAAARAAFVELLDYRDAATMTLECDLRVASLYAMSGDKAKVDEALAMLSDLGEYPGAADMAREATYQKALLLISEGKYPEASDILVSLKGYQNADTLYKDAQYQIAKQELEDKDYQAAAARFTSLGTYLDAAAQAKECVYRPAAALMLEEKYDEAAEMFASITGYRDSNTQRLDCIYKSALKAQLAGEYEYAAERFTLLGNYEDSNEQMKQSIYLAANTARDSASYERAFKLYSSISGFKDADDQAKACSYLPARALMTEGKYEEAAVLFALVPGYQDASELYMQCLYTPAVAALKENIYDAAIELLEQIPDYKDAATLLGQARYQRAEAFFTAGEYESAIEAFGALGDYEDAAQRVKACEYALAQSAFDLGQFTLASERFAALGKYSDAQTRVKVCAYELALLVLDSGDLQDAYDAFVAITEYAPAAEKARETAYALGEAYFGAGEMQAAAEAFGLAGKYKDAANRRLKSIYEQALLLMAEEAYQEAGALFDSISSYEDAKKKRDETYALWLADKAQEARDLYATGDYADVIALLKDTDVADLPSQYADLSTLYYESCLKTARKLIDEDRPLDAYAYLMACNGYKTSAQLLDKNIYKILGTWETDSGVRYAFYLNGTCVIDGRQLYFNMPTTYGITTGESLDNLTRTHSFTSASENGKSLTLRDDATERAIRLTRVKQAEVSPTNDSAGGLVSDVNEALSIDPDADADEGADEDAASG